jgi:hypothetical protein
MSALRRFHRDTTWTGTIAEGGMGPGTPAMTARGSGTHTTNPLMLRLAGRRMLHGEHDAVTAEPAGGDR